MAKPTDDEIDIEQLLIDCIVMIGVREEGTVIDLDTLIIDRQKAVSAIAAYVAQAERKARLTELKMLQDLYKNELKFTHRDETELRSYTQYRISELERQSDGHYK